MSASGVRSSCETAARKLARSSSAARSARRSRSTTTAPGSRPAIAENEAATGISEPSARTRRSSASTIPDGPSSTSSNRQRGPHRRAPGGVSGRVATSQPSSSRQVAGGPSPRSPRSDRGRAVDAHDAPRVVHGDDAVVRAVEDRGQERLLAGEGVAQLGGAEGDRELVADERQQPDPVRRQRRAVRRPERDEPDGPRSPAGLAQLPALVERHAVPAAPADPGVRVGRRREAVGDAATAPGSDDASGSVAHRRRSCVSAEASHSAPATASLTRTSSPITLAAITPSSPPSATSWLSWYCAKTVSAWRCASSKIRRRSAAVTADGCRPRLRASSAAVGQHRPHEQEARGRARVLVAARPLPEPEGEAAARDERPRRAHARVARPPRPARAPWRCRRRRVRRRRPRPPPAGARRRSSCRPVRHRPRRARPSAAASNASASPAASSPVRPATAIPASMNAVPYSEPPAPPTLATSSCPRLAQDLAGVARLDVRADRADGVAEPDAHVLAVVAIAEARVEAVQLGAVAHDRALRAPDPRAQVRGREGVGRRGRGSGMPVIAVPGAHARR